MSAGACAKYLRCWPDVHRLKDPRIAELSESVRLGVLNNVFTDEQIFRMIDEGAKMTERLDEEEMIRRESRQHQKRYENDVFGAATEAVLKEVEQS